MSEDLASWLLAQIADDEAAARATVPGPWRVSRDGLDVHADDLTVMENMDDPGPWHRALAAHIARHDPARVLAECAAKRAIVEHCVGMLRESAEWDDPSQATDAKHTLRLLAQPFADRPGFDPAWILDETPRSPR